MLDGSLRLRREGRIAPACHRRENIADALRAGPTFITKDATLLDWPSSPKGEYRVLRKRTNEWTCLPGIPGQPHDEPACFDRIFFQWMKDSMAGRTPHIDRIGIACMYGGFVREFHPGAAEFHVGPPLMIVTPHQDEHKGLHRDGSNGMPYVGHLPNRTELYLVMPIRQWDDPCCIGSERRDAILFLNAHEWKVRLAAIGR